MDLICIGILLVILLAMTANNTLLYRENKELVSKLITREAEIDFLASLIIKQQKENGESNES